jgi:1,2-diacylglycerol 3-beta-glucosyltransferase
MTVICESLLLLALPLCCASGYLLLLALASRRPALLSSGAPSLRFDLIVPAHDEESGIARTVQSLLAVDYPAALRRVLVVADNCTDATAGRARAAGAEVLVRDEPALRGKGYALAHAFQHSLQSGFADAVVVVDADSVVPANLLHAFAARLSRGAQAIQAGSAVLNVNDSWRTQLMALGLALFNGVRSLARDNLGLSCGLRGNGMCLSTATLRAHPPQAFSVVEDLEYGIALGRAGIRVCYAFEAPVASAMVSSGNAAASQRQRWDLGRKQLSRKLATPLLLEAVQRRSALLYDLALDLLIPPLSTLALCIAAGVAVAALVSWQQGTAITALWAWLASAAFVFAYVARGWALSGTGLRGLRAMSFAPFFVVWKLFVLARGGGAPRAQEWVRTAREEAPR